MAKSETNRSQEIRAYLTENPKATSKETIDALASKGIKINSGLYFAVKGKMHRRKVWQMRKKVGQTMATNPVVTPLSPIEVIRKVKGLAAEVGGLKKLKELVEVLSE